MGVHRGRGVARRGVRVVNVKPFLVDALSSALELGIGSPNDVVKHVTPDVLAQHLPRPLWARLLTACLGAPRVDAQLVVDTVGVPNLVEHVPATILWACIAEVAARALGKAVPEHVAIPKSGPAKLPLAPPPPDEKPVAATPAQPTTPARGVAIPSVGAQPAQPGPARFRQAGTGIGGGSRLGQPAARRPQVVATTVPRAASPTSGRRGGTEVEADTSTSSDIDVDDSQLVEWSETTEAREDDFSDIGRKR